jgi:hypothetical protein
MPRHRPTGYVLSSVKENLRIGDEDLLRRATVDTWIQQVGVRSNHTRCRLETNSCPIIAGFWAATGVHSWDF